MKRIVDFTPKEQREIMAKEIRYEDDEDMMFMHCKQCIDQFLGSPLHDQMSPRDYGQYEVASKPFEYPDGSMGQVVVVFCKRCHRLVWDSRHLTHLF